MTLGDKYTLRQYCFIINGYFIYLIQQFYKILNWISNTCKL